MMMTPAIDSATPRSLLGNRNHSIQVTVGNLQCLHRQGEIVKFEIFKSCCSFSGLNYCGPSLCRLFVFKFVRVCVRVHATDHPEYPLAAPRTQITMQAMEKVA
jgi:hypothetical protein